MDRIGLICRYIKEDPRSTQRDLAQKTGFSVGTVNTLIKEAMQKRLIAQGKSVAGTYELTGAGDDFLEQFKEKQLFAHKQNVVIHAPHNKIPAGSMPDPCKHPHNQNVSCLEKHSSAVSS